MKFLSLLKTAWRALRRRVSLGPVEEYPPYPLTEREWDEYREG